MVVRRYQDAIIFDTSVLYATVFYEGLSMWLYLTIAAQTLSNSPISITSLVVIVLTGLLIAIFLVFLQYQRKFEHTLVPTLTRIRFTRPLDYMLHFYRLHEVIERSSNPSNNLILTGMLREHAHYCADEKCVCLNILESLDDVKAHRQLKKEHRMGDDG